MIEYDLLFKGIFMMMRLATFFVDELLWMMTWGSYQIAFGLIFTWFLFILMGRMRLLRAFILTIGSYACALMTYFALVSCFFIYCFQWEFIAGRAPDVFNVLYASVYLGIILSVMQLPFFLIMSYWRRLSVPYFFIISLLSNLAAALCASMILRIKF